MFEDKSKRFARRSIVQGWKLIRWVRNRYASATEETYKKYKELLEFSLNQIKLMQEEYDKLMGRA